ncbi:MAG: hypothetical protein EBQ51_06680, partial [Verrucomicrobia bacterium]|nr:hypothetical protein [Verrucomicrobiota bacterium]
MEGDGSEGGRGRGRVVCAEVFGGWGSGGGGGERGGGAWHGNRGERPGGGENVAGGVWGERALGDIPEKQDWSPFDGVRSGRVGFGGGIDFGGCVAQHAGAGLAGGSGVFGSSRAGKGRVRDAGCDETLLRLRRAECLP